MTIVDAGLLFILLPAAVRGAWRGFFRESFALLGLLAGLYLACSATTSIALEIQAKFGLQGTTDEPLRGVVFVGLFLGASVVGSLIGFALERAFGGVVSGTVSRMAGSVVGAAKAGMVSAILLLFLHLFVPGVYGIVQSSVLGRTFVVAASNVLRSTVVANKLAPRG